MSIEVPQLRDMRKAMRADPDLARSWHDDIAAGACNKVGSEMAQKLASFVMRLAFEVDISKAPARVPLNDWPDSFDFADRVTAIK